MSEKKVWVSHLFDLGWEHMQLMTYASSKAEAVEKFKEYIQKRFPEAESPEFFNENEITLSATEVDLNNVFEFNFTE